MFGVCWLKHRWRIPVEDDGLPKFINNVTYGRCEKCGDIKGFGRLRAMWIVTCARWKEWKQRVRSSGR